MFDYLIIFLKSFIKRKRLFFGAILLHVISIILKVREILPKEQNFYLLVSACLATITVSLYFFSLKKCLVVKIIYIASMILMGIYVVLACLGILGVLVLPENFIV